MHFRIPPTRAFSQASRKTLKMNLRTCMVTACLILLSFESASLVAQDRTPASYAATIQGSAPTTRQDADGYSDSVYIHGGGYLPAFAYPAAFQYLCDLSPNGNTGYMTSLLFETETVGEHTVYIIGSPSDG